MPRNVRATLLHGVVLLCGTERIRCVPYEGERQRLDSCHVQDGHAFAGMTGEG